MTRFRHLLLILVGLLVWIAPAQADVFRPAYLELRELAPEHYAVLWKVPTAPGQRRLSAYPVFPEGAEVVSPPVGTPVDGALVERQEIRVPGGLEGKTIVIEGRALGVTQVIARIERLDGSSQVDALEMEQPLFTINEPAGAGQVAWSYFVLGVEHILGGIDHLLFVLALLLVVRGVKAIIATVTAFTVAHSITLAIATLGWVSVPGPPVEAIIALSIVFVASEVLHGLNGRPGLTARMPWVVAFSFGLLHGFGFAGALEEVGLPQAAIPLALLTFNLGVEAGQLLFVAVILSLRRLFQAAVKRPMRWATVATSYAIGSVAAFWVIERVASFWNPY
ncbi:HupE/UreJ family protein [Marinihelvus fidelis]|uniref:HupE/UreJ family protein n=1 Tax=Marinihelvus fidelis TaxID=2613842 RepID=A0A5N0THT0_9GAMM|nr:HupE/UreJ family protein [Marinihelvus fidelis]KAA9134014.1 HupE/UreJ family protein [Marinihelvus fidelis]